VNRRFDHIDKLTVDCYVYYLHGLFVVYLVTRLLYSLYLYWFLICNLKVARTFFRNGHFTVCVIYT
jgi:hypothetical protein